MVMVGTGTVPVSYRYLCITITVLQSRFGRVLLSLELNCFMIKNWLALSREVN
jgi:hypothetical protein